MFVPVFVLAFEFGFVCLFVFICSCPPWGGSKPFVGLFAFPPRSCYDNGDQQDHTLYAFPSIRRLSTEREHLADTVMEGLDPLTGPNLVKNPEMTDMVGHGWVDPVDDVGFAVFKNNEPITAALAFETGVVNACYTGHPRTNIFPVDASKDYEFSIWVKTDDITLNQYFGFHVFTAASADARYTSGIYSNPYFKTTDGDRNVWTRHVGYLRHTGSGSSGNSFEIPAGCTHALLRFLTCYGDGNSNGRSWFAFPTVRQIL
eukprot:m.123493 g.123493  ORF g.123493 m.123493 type:complete len:259 (+) comp16589_c0_seq1:66-842(+)